MEFPELEGRQSCQDGHELAGQASRPAQGPKAGDFNARADETESEAELNRPENTYSKFTWRNYAEVN